MSGFVATAPAAPASAPDDTIGNDGWFPDVSMAATRNAMRLDGTITNERLHPALVAAIISVNGQLRSYKTTQQAAGMASLAAVGAGALVGGQPIVVQLYLRAVMCTAKADLIERYRDYDVDGGAQRQRDNAPAIEEQRRNAHWAVRDILGQPHTVVELI